VSSILGCRLGGHARRGQRQHPRFPPDSGRPPAPLSDAPTGALSKACTRACGPVRRIDCQLASLPTLTESRLVCGRLRLPAGRVRYFTPAEGPEEFGMAVLERLRQRGYERTGILGRRGSRRCRPGGGVAAFSAARRAACARTPAIWCSRTNSVSRRPAAAVTGSRCCSAAYCPCPPVIFGHDVRVYRKLARAESKLSCNREACPLDDFRPSRVMIHDRDLPRPSPDRSLDAIEDSGEHFGVERIVQKEHILVITELVRHNIALHDDDFRIDGLPPHILRHVRACNLTQRWGELDAHNPAEAVSGCKEQDAPLPAPKSTNAPVRETSRLDINLQKSRARVGT
jgi:hypothetical protein